MFLVDSVDSMILYHLILILFSNIFFSIVGLLSHSRYAIIATIRGLVHVISLDIFVTVLYSVLVLSSQSANFHDFVVTQANYWYFFLLVYGSCWCINNIKQTGWVLHSFWMQKALRSKTKKSGTLELII